MDEIKRAECQGCIFNGEAVKCAVLELEWEWYDLKKKLPLLGKFAKEPDPCHLREVERND